MGSSVKLQLEHWRNQLRRGATIASVFGTVADGVLISAMVGLSCAGLIVLIVNGIGTPKGRATAGIIASGMCGITINGNINNNNGASLMTT